MIQEGVLNIVKYWYILNFKIFSFKFLIKVNTTGKSIIKFLYSE